MENDDLQSALERAEFAVRRITRSIGERPAIQPASGERGGGDKEQLQSTLRDAVAELDALISEARS